MDHYEQAQERLTCAKCDSLALPGAETYLGKPACYYHEDKISYLERTRNERS